MVEIKPIQPVVSSIRSTIGKIQRSSGGIRLLISLIILIPIVTASIAAPIVAPHEPTNQNVADRFEGPSSEYPLGTDNYGRDLLSRVIYGGQTSLLVGSLSISFALLLGVPIGLIAGYYDRFEETIMRILDVVMSFPTILLALLIIAGLGASKWNAVIAVGLVYSPRIARVVRASTISEKTEEYVEAAEIRGESSVYILLKEILPNITGPIIVEGSVRFGFAIVVAASLSFLGLGVQPPTASWGLMISNARDYIWQSYWYILWPSIGLALTILAFNLLGDGLEELLEVQSHE